MSSIAEQLDWEKECIERGSERYYHKQDQLREKGRGEQTDVFSYLLKDRIQEVADQIEALSKVRLGRGASNNIVLRRVCIDNDWLRLAYIGTQHAFQVLADHNKKNTILKVCLGIGKRLEIDMKCRLFEKLHPEYYGTVMKSMAQQDVTGFNHLAKTMSIKFAEHEVKWVDWGIRKRTDVGQRILRCVMAVFNDVLFINKIREGLKTTSFIDTTATFDTWAAEFEKERGFMYPQMLPMKIPPRDWENGVRGGYYTPKMITRLPLIKTSGKKAKQFINQHDPEQHRLAINKLQKTAWKINRRVLDVQKVVYENNLSIGMPASLPLVLPEFPKHLADLNKDDMSEEQLAELTDWKMKAKHTYAKEMARKSKMLSFIRTYTLAHELYDWDEFYYVYNCDFRGRIYCATADLSPQGADSAKGIIQFAEGVELGDSGVYWLAIQGANVYGVDKVAYADRVKWIKEHEPIIREVIKDPISNRGFWAEADKPYQFLAFCYEWADCDYGRNTKHKGHLPVGLDGSCNGLQHYSAMLRDEIGAKATNLLPCDKPQDIYGDVADVVMRKLDKLQSSDPMAMLWYRVGVTRKCAKRPVMTLPYGATRQSCRSYIFEYVVDNWAKFNLDEKHQWEYAKYLTPIMWDAIGEVVIAAREGMTWLQKNIGRDFVQWVTPIGFPVYQTYKDMPIIRIKTQLLGSLSLQAKDINSCGSPNRHGQRNGIAPNFVHSVDSTHMVLTINNSNLKSYAMIHDDYGTHAGNTDELFKVIRHQFYNLYNNLKPLEAWAEYRNISLDLLPKQGNYDIEQIYNADYFFG
jgi:DNA-directed RNA polymerase